MEQTITPLIVAPQRAAMALPVSRVQYAADVNTLKEQMATVKNATSVEQMVQLGVLAQETAAKLTKQMIMSIAAIEDRMATMETATAQALTTIQAIVQATAAQTTPVERKRKSLAESKCIANMKTLGSDKAEFRMWNEKFVNAIAQVLGTTWRTYMRNLNRQLDQDRRILTSEELYNIEGINDIGNFGDEEAEGIYYVLVEKTEGDAALRVNSGEPAQGLQAYMRVYLWFSGTTGMALSEKTRMLMHPNPVKHEWEIADALEKWAEQERTLRAHGDEYKLSAVFKVTALRHLMTCKREQFEVFEREARTKHEDKICDGMFED